MISSSVDKDANRRASARCCREVLDVDAAMVYDNIIDD